MSKYTIYVMRVWKWRSGWAGDHTVQLSRSITATFLGLLGGPPALYSIRAGAFLIGFVGSAMFKSLYLQFHISVATIAKFKFSVKQKESHKVGNQTLIRNRKARHEYTILEKFEVGIVLRGTEIKSIRGGHGNLQDSYARIQGEELFIEHFHVNPYEFGNINNHDPLRRKKLLLHKKEIKRLIGLTAQKGHTLVPLTAYLKRGKLKIELALAKGKQHGDKRDELKKRAQERDVQQELKQRNIRF